LHPNLEVDRVGDVMIARDDDTGLLLAFVASSPLSVRAIRGEEDPPAGWWSERFESAVPSWLVSADVQAPGLVYFAALLVPFEGPAAPEAHLELGVAGDAVRIEVIRLSGSHVLEIGFDPLSVLARDERTAGVT